MKKKKHAMMVLAVITAFMAAGLFMPGPVGAGDLEPGAPPGPTMKTLNELYNMTLQLKNSANTTRCVRLGYSFCDQGDGTVLDADTGLVWLKNAYCMGLRKWAVAQTVVASLADGTCGLSDGSQAGDWRLPTKEEWEALIDTTYAPPAVTNALGTGKWSQGDAFYHVLWGQKYYWSSTTHPDYSDAAWIIHLADGGMWGHSKTSDCYVWPVRSPY